MEKKIFKRTKDIFVQKNIFDKLNEKLEKICLNSKIIFLVEPFYYLKYEKEITELKKYSLNFINIIILKNFGEKSLNNVECVIDESASLLLVLGEKECVNFSKRLAIKNNINSVFLCENISNLNIFSVFCWEKHKKEIFWNNSLPATFIVIKEPNIEENDFQFQMYSYFSNLLFYELENFLSNIFLNNKKIKFYFDSENSMLNNVVINELNFQKNKINNNILDEIIFYSKLKNCCENKILISLLVLNLYRGFISKISFNNCNFKNYFESVSLMEKFSYDVACNYLTDKITKKENVCYQIYTTRKFLLKRIDATIKKIKEYSNCMKLLNGTNFSNMKKFINVKAILNGIKLTSKVTKNKTFLRIIDEFGFLN